MATVTGIVREIRENKAGAGGPAWREVDVELTAQPNIPSRHVKVPVTDPNETYTVGGPATVTLS